MSLTRAPERRLHLRFGTRSASLAFAYSVAPFAGQRVSAPSRVYSLVWSPTPPAAMVFSSSSAFFKGVEVVMGSKLCSKGLQSFGASHKGHYKEREAKEVLTGFLYPLQFYLGDKESQYILQLHFLPY